MIPPTPTSQPLQNTPQELPKHINPNRVADSLIPKANASEDNDVIQKFIDDPNIDSNKKKEL